LEDPYVGVLIGFKAGEGMKVEVVAG